MDVAKVNFGETIGSGDCFWGTTLQEVRYIVEGYSAFDSSVASTLPKSVELHFWKCLGGEVFEGYAIYNYLRELSKKGVVVKSYSHGLTASIAVLVFLAADERYVDHASQGFTHKPSCDLGAYANADDMRQAASDLDKIQLQIAEVYVSRAGITLEQAHTYLNSNAWQTADEMVTSGFATAKTTDVLVAPAGAEKVINYFKPPLKPQNMAITEADETRLVDKFINAAKSLFAPKNQEPEVPAVTNLSVALAGDAGSIYVDTESTDIAQGDLVYSDEALTLTAADGSYELADGRSITVTAGAIESITEVAAADDSAASATNALNERDARIAELEQQLAAKDSELTGATNTVRNLQTKLKAVPGSTGNPNTPGLQVVTNKSTVTPKASGGILSVKRS